MDNIYEDISNKETVEIKIFDQTGLLNYSSEDCVMKGRGNSTWAASKNRLIYS
jgi:hypothetical protein